MINMTFGMEILHINFLKRGDIAVDIEKAISAALALPPEVVSDIPKITLIGKERMRVENYTALVEYQKENIKLKFTGGVIDILGKNFEIRTIGEANIVISGEIETVRFV